jgi:hypothetical protein
VNRLQHVLEHDNTLSAGIGQLMPQLAGRVLGVPVDHNTTGPQNAEHSNRVLQNIRHH